MPLESGDGRNLYYSRPGEPGNLTLWQMPVNGGEVNGGEETKVLDHLLYPRAFIVARHGIYFLEGKAISWAPAGNSLDAAPPLRFFDFGTRRLTTIGSVQGANLTGRIAASPDERWIVYGHDDGTGSDLMIVENFR
jgi:hypothetical protein